MTRLLKPKLIFPLVIVVMLASAIAVSLVSVPLIRSQAAAPSAVSSTVTADASTGNLLMNPGFEKGSGDTPTDWSRGSWAPAVTHSWDRAVAHSGHRSVEIVASTPNDAFWTQSVSVQRNTRYRLSGWIKTAGVAHTSETVDAGANVSFLGRWDRSPGVVGTHDWTFVSLTVDSGDQTQLVVAARLGFWGGTTTGTAWFDDLRLALAQPVHQSSPHWKILVLIYPRLDFTYQGSDGQSHHAVATMTQSEQDQAAASAKAFVANDIPALDSGYMVPSVTVRFPGTLTRLDATDNGWWPSPGDTASDRDPNFDSVIVIWDPNVVDLTTGRSEFIGTAAGLTPSMGLGQTYVTMILDAAISYGHRNVFKHEWGHSILFFFDAAGTAPTPTVTNHAGPNDYVHCPTGKMYVWEDETLAHPIPNSIYNDTSGFTHDYYSGTTATPDQPTRCLGITKKAWQSGTPLSLRTQVLFAPSDEVNALIAMVDDLVHRGRLSDDRAASLDKHLTSAAADIHRTDFKAAIKAVEDFIGRARSFKNSGKLSSTDYDQLTEAASNLIDTLRALQAMSTFPLP